MITYIVIHLWCWMWNLGVGKNAAYFFALLSVIETIAEICIASLIIVALYNEGLRIGRENGRWWIKWDESAKKKRSSY